ncbi:MAG: M20/M25/M40 family metallo-hydrolase [Clostridia bacterium]|nr:M20/M25/M40 family metallo-hydrolase [Clostridia bacterium]
MLLSEITALRGPSGHEHEVREALRGEAERLLAGCEGARVYADTMGNLYAHRPGRDKKKKHVMLAAHMDEVGFIIRYATAEGLLRFAPVGGVDPRVIASRRVLVGDDRVPGVIGFKAVHLMTAEDRERAPGYDMLSIDIGASSKEEAEKRCPPGTYATFDSGYTEFGDGFVKAKALDDRVGCLVLLHALADSAYDGDMTCVFTVQEECGLRGARIAVNKVKPDLALILEGTTANDMGDVPSHLQVTACGKGAVVSLMDRSAIMDKALREKAMQTAEARGIPAQYKRFVAGGTDAGPIHMAQGGIPCLVMAVPCRYIHSPASVCRLSDVDALCALTLALLDEINQEATV